MLYILIIVEYRFKHIIFDTGIPIKLIITAIENLQFLHEHTVTHPTTHAPYHQLLIVRCRDCPQQTKVYWIAQNT